ncbi:hypothetical protein [Desulfosporosinus sp. OT]|uniref:hypothetical protein n=1 Tax=Desulfosporosinus sp. OT TaxID=913865 RepID=UPI000223A387|nr:hypothetical protein [Desulfosporosinus sp. OT]EGW36480.1 hypothetical protein DOT_5644 [Desulfosporosinus sp. OT]
MKEMSAKTILKALRERHQEREWAFFRELRVGTGYRNVEKGLNPEQRLDAWAINLYPSKNFLRIAYEIKVSRGDFLREINNPQKREQALQLSNQFYFAAPVGLIKPEEIPEEVGLIEVFDEWQSMIKVSAPVREGGELPWQFLASIARRVQREEIEHETSSSI